MAKPNKKIKPAESLAPVERQEPESAPAQAPLSAPAASEIPAAALKVRVLMSARAMGPGICLAQGQQYELDAKFAAALIKGGYAKEVALDSQRETR